MSWSALGSERANPSGLADDGAFAPANRVTAAMLAVRILVMCAPCISSVLFCRKARTRQVVARLYVSKRSITETESMPIRQYTADRHALGRASHHNNCDRLVETQAA